MDAILGSSRKAASAEVIVKLNRNGTATILKDRYGELVAEVQRTSKGRFLVLSRRRKA